MTARRRQLGDVVQGRRSSGVWGAAAAAGVMAVLLAYLLYAHLYLSVTADRWPPDGTPPLPVLRPAVLVGVAVLAAAASLRAGRPLAPRHDQLRLAGRLATGAVLGAAAIAGGALLVADLELAATDRAHDASLLLLHGFAGAVALVGVAINALAAYEAARLGDHPWVAAAAAVASIWWTTVALAWAAIGAVAYLVPQLTGGGG